MRTAVSLIVFAWLASCALVAWPQEAKPIRIGIVTFLSGPGAGPFGVPARNAAELTFEALNAGDGPGAVSDQGIRRQPGRDGSARRGGAGEQCGHAVPQPGAARCRHRHRLCLQRQLPGDRADRRGVEEAHGVLRLRDPARVRGRQLPVRVPNRLPRDDGQRRRGQVRPGQLSRRDSHRGHQPELRLGPGFMEGLRDLDEGGGSGCSGHDLADAEAVRRPVWGRDLRIAREQAGRDPFQPLGRGPGGIHPAVGSPQPVQEQPRAVHHG